MKDGDPYLGLITPNILAAARIQKLLATAKTTPDPLIKAAPTASVLLRPKPSATSVKSRLTTTSPSRVSVMKSPMRASDTPRLDKCRARINVVVP